MISKFKSIRDEKKEYKKYKVRVSLLPDEYKETLINMEKYILMQSKDGSIMEVMYGIINLFEQGIAESKTVEEIVGKNPILFCDDLLKEVPEKLWINKYREKLSKK